MSNTTVNVIYEEKEPTRLDAFLAISFPDFPRSFIQKQIANNLILVNDKAENKSFKLKEGDQITGSFSVEDKELLAEHTNLNIIFENDDVILVNKPAGLVVHPGSGNKTGTLVNYLLGYNSEIKNAVIDPDDEYESIRPGIVHRLDKDTTGILIVAKNARALSSVSKQIKNRKVKKTYLALCVGWPKHEKGTLENNLGRSPKNRKVMADLGPGLGKEAISKYKVQSKLQDKKSNKISLLEFNIKTGRTHQIRVQSKIFGHPVLGDTVYFNKTSDQISKEHNIKRQMLHAASIDFFLPGETTISHFEAPMPNDIKSVLDDFGNKLP